MKSIAGAGLLLVLAGCNAGPDNGALAEAEAQGSKDAAISGRIDCALGGAKLFDRTCTIAEMSSADGTILIVGRSDSGYRRYGEQDLHVLAFIKRSRDLGFSLEQIRALLGLWQDQARPSREVRALAQAHLAELEAKLAELQAMKATLAHLVHCCHGDDRPDCPILDDLARH